MVNYENKTVVELRQIARNKGLTGYSRLNKKDLINMIRQGNKGGPKKKTPKRYSPKKTPSASKCPTGKILNPATGRCVNKNGKIGQALLGKQSIQIEKDYSNMYIPDTFQAVDCFRGDVSREIGRSFYYLKTDVSAKSTY